MDYKKATAEIIYFSNKDVIATSGYPDDDIGGTACEKPGWNKGNGCPNTSGSCPTKHAWKNM